MTLRLIAPNDADIATLSSSPALVASLPVTNLQDQTRERVARSTSLLPQQIRADWASPRPINAAALVRHNLTSAAVLRLRLWAAMQGYARDNLFKHSSAFDNTSAWTASSGVTFDSAATTAPDGTLTAYKMKEKAAVGPHQVFQTISVEAGVTYSFAFHVQAAERANILFQIGAAAIWGTASSPYVYFNLSDGSISSSGYDAAGAIEDAGGGWYRCIITDTAATSGSTNIALYLADTTPTWNYTGDGSSGIYLWGSSANRGAICDYVATTTAADDDGTVTVAPLYDSGRISLAEDIPAWGEFAWGAVPWGASVFSDWPLAFHSFWLPEAYNAQSLALDITDFGNTDGYVQASRLFAGQYFQPQKNVNWGAGMSWRENSTQRRTAGGSLRTDGRDPYRAFRMRLDWLAEGDRAALVNILRRNGLRNDLFMSLYPGEGGSLERDFAAQVKLVQSPDVAVARTLNWGSDLIFEES